MGVSGIGTHEADRDPSSTQEPAADEETSRAQWVDGGGFEAEPHSSTEAERVRFE